MVSVPDVGSERLAQLEGEGIRLLRVSRHGNKLKAGHLRGNRFRVLIRDGAPAAGERLPPLLARLQTLGFPNYYGPQRFGRDGETLQLGLALLHGARQAEGGAPDAAVRLPRSGFLRRLALSAAQSALFNHYLGCRLADGLLHTVLGRGRHGQAAVRWLIHRQ